MGHMNEEPAVSGFRIEGLDRLQRKLKDLGRKAQALDGEHRVSVAELFPPDFMARHTDFQNAQEMFDKSGFEIESKEDFERITDAQWDSFIRPKTRFSSWKDMLTAATGEWTSKKLGLR